MREIGSFKDMATRVHALLDQADGSDIAIFPQLFTIELFTTLPNWRERPIAELVKIAEHTQACRDLFRSEAKRRGLFIGAGSNLEEVSPDRYENIAHLFGPDGEHFMHAKTHIFPAEAAWSTSEGDRMEAFRLPFAKVGFNVCYETEIPECAAAPAEQGGRADPDALGGLHRAGLLARAPLRRPAVSRTRSIWSIAASVASPARRCRTGRRAARSSGPATWPATSRPGSSPRPGPMSR
ncbi:Carbon-nitrogen hydrolase [Paracoccus pantotrophus]|nr:Carbon-nitrogen hydrolase [Paracoccus pantotrophus]